MADLEIYLDNAATTRTEQDIAEAMARDMVAFYANPSSVHRPGLAAHRRLADARREVEARFKDRSIVFTASGSEALQGLGKVPVDPAAWEADSVAIASHKIHGPKGMGALILRKGVALAPLVSGGGQEGGLRSGTENVAGVVGFTTAIGRAIDGLAAHRERRQSLKMRL